MCWWYNYSVWLLFPNIMISVACLWSLLGIALRACNTCWINIQCVCVITLILFSLCLLLHLTYCVSRTWCSCCTMCVSLPWVYASCCIFLIVCFPHLVKLLSADGKKKTFHYTLNVPTAAPCIAFVIGWDLYIPHAYGLRRCHTTGLLVAGVSRCILIQSCRKWPTSVCLVSSLSSRTPSSLSTRYIHVCILYSFILQYLWNVYMSLCIYCKYGMVNFFLSVLKTWHTISWVLCSVAEQWKRNTYDFR